LIVFQCTLAALKRSIQVRAKKIIKYNHEQEIIQKKIIELEKLNVKPNVQKNSKKNETVYEPGEGPSMHCGLPCSNADEIRAFEKGLKESWERYEARGYRN